ncbi:3-beta hydroxysteroid dehydrogenase [Superficieibacter electus]|uniref:3-beta hydroxysteroid dehydrogenase n=1 Tax=Superficieibacter electus TaxID=2022662 RepID=A0A2P5GNK1_9ENTR|nr:SDR family oxidoreductase [Superficieibacter electus]POP43648.1 3-beta hydroxysteroid dehydrogenase [Superficieibacter electus]POP48116.1 3-beta hydroxysteroid dehydrogenase [Superficieibacter electus]
MHVFVTGASGWLGSAVVEELLSNGHQVSGLVRADEQAVRLTAAGAQAVKGSLEDVGVLTQAAANADAVIHTAFNHDFSRFIENCEQDRRTIELLGDALAGSDRPLLVTSGLSGLPKGATELDLPNPASLRKSESAARALNARGIHAAAVRLPPSVHGIGDHGFLPILIRLAREKGISAWPGNSNNCWSGVHRLDAARVYRLALEQGVTEQVYHAVAEEAIPLRTIAQTIGRNLGLPSGEREAEHFGWFAMMAAADMAVSSEQTRRLLNWQPQEADLLTDLNHPSYYSL